MRQNVDHCWLSKARESDLGIAIRGLGPLHDDKGEVDAEEEANSEVSPEPFGRLLNTLIVGQGATEVNVSLSLDVSNVLIPLVELLWSAVVSLKLAIEEVVSFVTFVEHKVADYVCKE